MSLEDFLKDGATLDTVWAVHSGDTEFDDGKPEWWFLNAKEADDEARGRGFYGGHAPVSVHRAIIIGDTEVYLLGQPEPVVIGGPKDIEEQRRKVLSKLTDAEKRLLGLTDA